jgi:succinate-semialdehyde dehydrogenase/glutarate-semialdehyde dehydrogenase
VVNVLAGRTAEIGETLTASPKIRKLTITGSTEVGKDLIRACAVNVKRTTMELGGNAPFIVFDDADLDAAVEGAIASKYRNAGQTCVCANRMLVQSGVYDAFSEKLTAAVRELKLGDGFEDGVKVGPLIDAKAANDVLSMVEDAVQRGATLVLGGKRAANGDAFVEPAVLTDVTREMRVFNEEIFGPVAPLIRFDTEEEAIEMANDTPFGLASYFYARDMGRIWRVSEGLEYGIVGVNAGLISNEMAPFGGVKESGSGREGSKYGIEDYVEIKYLCLGGI